MDGESCLRNQLRSAGASLAAIDVVDDITSRTTRRVRVTGPSRSIAPRGTGVPVLGCRPAHVTRRPVATTVATVPVLIQKSAHPIRVSGSWEDSNRSRLSILYHNTVSSDRSSQAQRTL
jgi:hypothetical protein